MSLGLLAGFVGGSVDAAISWLTDLILSIPLILFIFAVVPVVGTWFGSGSASGSGSDAQMRLWTMVCVFVLFGWPQMARLIRGEVLSLRERGFVDAARLIGMPTRRIVPAE